MEAKIKHRPCPCKLCTEERIARHLDITVAGKYTLKYNQETDSWELLEDKVLITSNRSFYNILIEIENGIGT